LLNLIFDGWFFLNKIKNHNNRNLNSCLSNIDSFKIYIEENLLPIVSIDKHHPCLTVEIKLKIKYLKRNKISKFNFKFDKFVTKINMLKSKNGFQY